MTLPQVLTAANEVEARQIVGRQQVAAVRARAKFGDDYHNQDLGEIVEVFSLRELAKTLCGKGQLGVRPAKHANLAPVSGEGAAATMGRTQVGAASWAARLVATFGEGTSRLHDRS